MGFCPICKNEFQEQFTTCPDCKVNLVEALAHDGKQPMYKLRSKEIFDKFVGYLEYSKIPVETDVNPEDGTYEVYSVRKKDEMKISQAFMTCVSCEAEKELLNHTEAADIVEDGELSAQEFETLEEVAENEADDSLLSQLAKEEAVNELSGTVFRHTKSYESMEHKASESKSSGIMLICFGIGGLIFVALNVLGKIKLINVMFSQIVLTTFFLAMLVVGFISLKSAKKYMEQSGEENDDIQALKDWMKINATPEVIVKAEEKELSEVERILNEQQRLTEMVTKAFPDMDESIINHFTEEFYTENFLQDQTEELENETVI